MNDGEFARAHQANLDPQEPAFRRTFVDGDLDLRIRSFGPINGRVALALCVLGWGPNATFGYPATRGTVGLWLATLPFIGPERIRYRKRAVCVDGEKREIRFADCSTRRYDRLLTTSRLAATRSHHYNNSGIS